VPTTAEHLAQAESNEQASLAVQPRFPDWAATMLFYAALHYVEAYFFADADKSHLPAHYDRHSERLPAVRTRIGPIFVHYKDLMDASLEARYQYVSFTQVDVENLRQEGLEPLKRHINTLLSADTS